MEVKNIKEVFTITLSSDEVIVLFEWLANFNEIGNSNLFQDQSEEKNLFDLECQLERKISESFKLNYKEILIQAIRKLRNE